MEKFKNVTTTDKCFKNEYDLNFEDYSNNGFLLYRRGKSIKNYTNVEQVVDDSQTEDNYIYGCVMDLQRRRFNILNMAITIPLLQLLIEKAVQLGWCSFSEKDSWGDYLKELSNIQVTSTYKK